jgi:hypothetical protein
MKAGATNKLAHHAHKASDHASHAEQAKEAAVPAIWPEEPTLNTRSYPEGLTVARGMLNGDAG